MDHDYDDYAPRHRRYYADYDDYGYRRPEQRSDCVIGLAIVSFLLAALVLFIALMCLFAGFMMSVEGRGRDRDEAYIPLTIGSFGFLLGIGYILSGVGLLMRRNWGRVTTLILAAFNFLGAAGGIIGMVAIIAQSNRLRDDAIVGAFFICFGVVLNLGYGLMAYLTLLRSEIVSEFR